MLRPVWQRVRRGERGLTIVEAMVAMLVLAVGVLGTVELVSSTKRGSAVAERTSVGVVQAEQELEELRDMEYDKLALAAAPQATSDPEDPRSRVSGGRFQVKQGLSEELVLASSGGIAPTVVKTLGSADNPTRVTIHRFISWRDEECLALDLSRLDQLVNSLPGLIHTVTGSLTVLLGPNGSIQSLLDTIGAIGRLPVAGALLSPLLGILNPLLQSLEQLSSALAGVLNPLSRLLAPLNAIGGSLSQRLDLCDLDLALVRKLGELETLRALLSALSPLLRSLEVPIGTVNSILVALLRLDVLELLTAILKAVTQLPAVVNGLLGTLTKIPQVLVGLGTDLPRLGQHLTTIVGSLTSTLKQLLAQPDTERNTKRITVAVVVDSPHQSGPQRPIWASTVVIDPDEGLGG